MGDTASGSHGHTAATAAAAFSIRTPGVPVIHTGHLDTRQQFSTNFKSCDDVFYLFSDQINQDITLKLSF